MNGVVIQAPRQGFLAGTTGPLNRSNNGYKASSLGDRFTTMERAHGKSC